MIETIWEIMVNLLESTIFILFFTRIFSVRSKMCIRDSLKLFWYIWIYYFIVNQQITFILTNHRGNITCLIYIVFFWNIITGIRNRNRLSLFDRAITLNALKQLHMSCCWSWSFYKIIGHIEYSLSLIHIWIKIKNK